MQAVTAKGSTPASNSPTDIATAIGDIPTGSKSIKIPYLYSMYDTSSEFGRGNNTRVADITFDIVGLSKLTIESYIASIYQYSGDPISGENKASVDIYIDDVLVDSIKRSTTMPYSLNISGNKMRIYMWSRYHTTSQYAPDELDRGIYQKLTNIEIS